MLNFCCTQLFDKIPKKVSLCFCHLCCLFELWILRVVICCTSPYGEHDIYYLLHATDALVVFHLTMSSPFLCVFDNDRVICYWWVIIFLHSTSLCDPFDNCSVLNYSSLVCFHLLGFIGPLFWIWTNITLFGLIFVFNYFWVFGWRNCGAWTLIFSWRELSHHCHIISTSSEWMGQHLRPISDIFVILQPIMANL